LAESIRLDLLQSPVILDDLILDIRIADERNEKPPVFAAAHTFPATARAPSPPMCQFLVCGFVFTLLWGNAVPRGLPQKLSTIRRLGAIPLTTPESVPVIRNTILAIQKMVPLATGASEARRRHKPTSGAREGHRPRRQRKADE
jgi:hypothetical protein